MNKFANSTSLCSVKIGIIDAIRDTRIYIYIYEVFHVNKDKIFNSLLTIICISIIIVITNKRGGVIKILKILWTLNIVFFLT